jgi:hypothetical protein
LCKALFETDEAYSERFGASNDIHENLVKAKNVYRKALDLIAQARSSMIADNRSICDLDYVRNSITILGFTIHYTNKTLLF